MSAQERFKTPAAFRRALEQRLRGEALSTGTPLNRLRREAASNRLLVRLCLVDSDRWVLKGGLALIVRIGVGVRGTKDVDTNWRSDRRDLEETLTFVEELDFGDWFNFRIGDPRPLQGEGEPGALRYPVTASLDGRTFEQLSLDVNFVSPNDPRPVDLVAMRRNAFQFVDEPPLRVPMVTPSQQLAEKLHAYTRLYDDEPSSRARDLFDMLVIADQVQLPDSTALTVAVRQTFDIRATAWPPSLAAPPADWAMPWRAFITDYPLQWESLDEAYTALKEFWAPILSQTTTKFSTWGPHQWRWS
ncbi:nucleotidyl transferase AbiEii/AbiGii toxin family protein [Actinopolymorpha rutila]|uniref:Nucleotidyl transferase AbiEii toxin, Type IV TA system n=1 Tax=Actinopolymorpha rutila TaxID=446787 RepID=A0A852ZWR4_9ACTN|nr:nucleotidyl transferase AbiEii/AbiGii toxin family protein [Actinopolymorpha rutila]NYH93400.1 hypothetical protein [Actinopolymorpha rutila]